MWKDTLSLQVCLASCNIFILIQEYSWFPPISAKILSKFEIHMKLSNYFGTNFEIIEKFGYIDVMPKCIENFFPTSYKLPFSQWVFINRVTVGFNFQIFPGIYTLLWKNYRKTLTKCHLTTIGDNYWIDSKFFYVRKAFLIYHYLWFQMFGCMV